jgi:hypothetical protein
MTKLIKYTWVSRRTALIAAILLIAAIAAVIALTGNNKNTGYIPTTNPMSNSDKNTPIPASNSSNQPPQSNSSATNSQATSGPPPAAPTGNFVSNHHPGGSAPTSEASTCNTTPGAVCYIQFTKGSDVKKLDSRTIDSNGGALWYWDVKTAGLGSGSWTITAVATLNGHTETANDALPLVVQ